MDGREVIERRPEEFKINCLKQIRAIFPDDFSPLHAGFGNRHTVSPRANVFYCVPTITIAPHSMYVYHVMSCAAGAGMQDVKSYTNVGIPESRIFTVNHKVHTHACSPGCRWAGQGRACKYVD